MIWTSEQVSQAIDLLKKGRSAAQVAAALNLGLEPGDYLSRSAVIGKMKRIGVALNPQKRASIVEPKRVIPYRERYPVVPKPKPNDEPEPSLIDEWEFLETEDLARSAQVEDPTQRNVPLVDLAPGRCHWPVTGMETDAHLFCGDLATRRPYCETHRKLAYTPPPVFKRKRARTVTSQIAMGVNRIVA